jgi:hypothetical protein
MQPSKPDFLAVKIYKILERILEPTNVVSSSVEDGNEPLYNLKNGKRSKEEVMERRWK